MNVSNKRSVLGSLAVICEKLLFSYSRPVLAFFVVVSIFLGYQASMITLDASFDKMIPSKSPMVVNFRAHEADLRSLTNVLRITVENVDGDIFDKEYLETLRSISDEVFYIAGVDRGNLKSAWTANAFWRAVTDEGFESGPVIPNGFDGSPEKIERFRQNVLRSGLVGSLFANDFRSSVIYVPLIERMPGTGEKLDYGKFSEQLEKQVRDKYSKGKIRIRITGFAKVIGDLIDGTAAIGKFFGLAVALTTVLLLLYSRCWRSTLSTLFCCLLAVIWQLGIVRLLGYGLDPYSILVPFLTFAIGVSHAVQNINTMAQGVGHGLSNVDAARSTFQQLFVPGTVALLCDAVGFATLLVIDIPVIKELAVAASVGVGVVIFTKMFLLPVLMSYSGISPPLLRYLEHRKNSTFPVARILSRFASRPFATVAIAVAVIGLGTSFYFSRDLKIGDLDPGAPELRANSRYNRDNAYLVDHYSTSTDVFVVMVKTPEEKCRTYEVLAGIEQLAAELGTIPNVQATRSIVDIAKTSISGGNEGNPKWFSLVRDQATLGSALRDLSGASVGTACEMAPLAVYLGDHKAETLAAVVEKVREFAAKHNSDKVQFVLAAGNAGIEAATNEVIKKAEPMMLILVYGIVTLLVLLEFKSTAVAICIVVPLYMTSVLCEAIMAKMGLGVKVSTMPVIALGVGIGVDYGIYIYNKLKHYLDRGESLVEAYFLTLRTTGTAVAFTGFTLAVGVFTWVFSNIKFQADMGLLLTFMFLWNMIGAIIMIPALAAFLIKPKNGPKE